MGRRRLLYCGNTKKLHGCDPTHFLFSFGFYKKEVCNLSSIFMVIHFWDEDTSHLLYSREKHFTPLKKEEN